VVVVSHVSPIKSAVAWALGVDIGISFNCHLDQAAVCRIAVRAGRPILQTFNETAAVANDGAGGQPAGLGYSGGVSSGGGTS
jgi:broad specificity phosphatase PhoE